MTREMSGVVHAADKLLACFFQSATTMPLESAVKATLLSLVYGRIRDDEEAGNGSWVFDEVFCRSEKSDAHSQREKKGLRC